jgi:hypothetical protein
VSFSGLRSKQFVAEIAMAVFDVYEIETQFLR